MAFFYQAVRILHDPVRRPFGQNKWIRIIGWDGRESIVFLVRFCKNLDHMRLIPRQRQRDGGSGGVGDVHWIIGLSDRKTLIPNLRQFFLPLKPPDWPWVAPNLLSQPMRLLSSRVSALPNSMTNCRPYPFGGICRRISLLPCPHFFIFFWFLRKNLL